MPLPRSARRAPIVAAGVVIAAVLAGCAQSPAGRPSSAGTPVRVVASTNVWGDIVAAIGGPSVSVTSLITDPTADPHSFEASPRTQLAVSRAQVVLVNGGGYDDVLTRLLSTADAKATVIDAVEVSGRGSGTAPEAGGLNEHVWYDLPSVAKVADRVAAVVSAADPQHAADVQARAATFRDGLNALAARVETARARTRGVAVAITEPVPAYLLSALGAVDRTPPELVHAVERGDEVAPAVLAQTMALFRTHAVRALVYNAQTSSAQTDAVRRAAADANVPAVPVTETLPPGTTYLRWMGDNVTAISAALSS